MKTLPYIVALSIVVLVSCGRDNGSVSPMLEVILADSTANAYDTHLDSVPNNNCVPLRTHLRQAAGREFNDINDVHLRHARRGGIRSVADELSLWKEAEGLVEVKSNRLYYVDELNHSFAYLRPHAALLLAEIGRRFHDSLQARGGGAYRPKVTSLLRTPLSVGRLRRVNRNATGESAHQYATTFDISYSKFICDDAQQTHRTFEDLKNLLAEILSDLRDEGRCVVKHERRQACFHITATAPEYE